MCIFCASIPAAAAIGAKLNADQLHKEKAQRRPIPRITAIVVGLLALGSIVYHTLIWKT